MRFLRSLGAVLFTALAAVALAPLASARAVPSNCTYQKGQPLTKQPWPQQRLNFVQAWQVTDGLNVQTGARVEVAVIDSGLDQRDNPQLSRISADPVVHLAGGKSLDCVGHGTEATSIIAAHPTNTSLLVGVAPAVHVLPLQDTNAEKGGSVAALVAALKVAVQAKVAVINLSLQQFSRPPATVIAELRQVERADIVVVAAGGNDSGQGSGPAYPAALSTEFTNIIAVSAVDASDSVGTFSVKGQYIDVAAPGVNVPVAERVAGYAYQNGTSFAAPFVTGTVALVRGAHPGMSAEQVRTRLEATADPPPGRVPDAEYGYGVINPLLAVTSTGKDSVATEASGRGAALPAPGPPAAADRSLEHRALAIAFVLLGVAALTITAAATLRGNRSAGRHPA